MLRVVSFRPAFGMIHKNKLSLLKVCQKELGFPRFFTKDFMGETKLFLTYINHSERQS